MSNFQIVLAESAALGNGTRPPGFTLGTVSGCESFGNVTSAAREHVGNRLELFPLEVVLAEGVKPVEMMTALRNPHLIRSEADNKPSPKPAPVEKPKPASWEDSKLADLEIPNMTALHGAGLLTVRDVLRFEQTQGLETISGIGQATKEAILEAIDETRPAA